MNHNDDIRLEILPQDYQVLGNKPWSIPNFPQPDQITDKEIAIYYGKDKVVKILSFISNKGITRSFSDIEYGWGPLENIIIEKIYRDGYNLKGLIRYENGYKITITEENHFYLNRNTYSKYNVIFWIDEEEFSFIVDTGDILDLDDEIPIPISNSIKLSDYRNKLIEIELNIKGLKNE